MAASGVSTIQIVVAGDSTKIWPTIARVIRISKTAFILHFHAVEPEKSRFLARFSTAAKKTDSPAVASDMHVRTRTSVLWVASTTRWDMNKGIIIGGLLILGFILYRQWPRTSAKPETTPSYAASTEAFQKNQRNISTVNKPRSMAAQPATALPAAGPQEKTTAAQPTEVTYKFNTPGIAAEDMDLLKQIAEKAQHSGNSRVAYIGESSDLYAIEPHFFVNGANNQAELHQVQAFEDGKMVQREAYPVPSGQDPANISAAVRKAVDEGAMVINLSSAKIDRSRLADAISYARSKGVLVVAVPPASPK
jgi:hypothetical protein